MNSRIVESLGLVCALSGCLPPARATTIVIIRTPQEVVIAADSAAIIRGDGRPATTESVCKIYQTNPSLFFAVSGLVNDPRTRFDIPHIVAAAIEEGRGMAEKLAAVENKVRTAVLRELPNVKERDPSGYAKLINSKGAVTVALVGLDAGIPAATSFSLGLAPLANGSIETSFIRDSCPGNCPSGVRAFWLGESAAIERQRAADALPKLGMPDLARYLVQVEIDAGAPSVGGPIDVLRILRSGPVWVERKSDCPAIIRSK